MVVLVDWKQYVMCKEMLIIFCQQFKTLPKNDFAFILEQKNLLVKEPQLYSYFYQFLLEAAYYKKKFNNYDITKAFENHFQIIDHYNLNGGMSDMSTLNTSFIIYKLATDSPFKKLPFKIISNPLDYHHPNYELAKKIPNVQKIREESILQTGQPNCDLQMGNRWYDIKHTSHLNTKKNIINPITREILELKGESHLKNVYQYLTNEAKIDPKLLYKIREIINEKKFSISEKNLYVNEHLADNFMRQKIPPNITIPLLIETTQKPYTSLISKEFRETYPISHDIVDNPVSARKAISGILNKWGNMSYKKNAMLMTENGLPLSFDDSLEVD